MTNQLIDAYGRRIDYMRLSVTDRCDLRCFYCLPENYREFNEPETWLNFNEIEMVVRAFTELGTSRIRLTGGEPLVRHGIEQLAIQLSTLPGLTDLSLSTNATRLAKLAPTLFDAGIRRINVSLDSLRPERFRQITKGKLERVLSGLQRAKEVGFEPIKINTVLMRGVNDDEILDLANYCISNGFTLRFIETMPIGATGLNASDYYVSLQNVRDTLAQHFNLIADINGQGGGPARYWRSADGKTSIGFITPMSQHFCETCNRVRVSAEGTLYLCLGQDQKVELRPLLRDNISLEDLKQVIVDAIRLKPERHEFLDKPSQVVRFMAATGG